MKKLLTTKLNMSQQWLNDEVIAISVLKAKENAKNSLPFEEIKEGERVTVSGISKGKGFQGVVKRHGFHGGPKTHGQKNRLRAPGSIGATAPQRVIKGKRMAGHAGSERITVKGLLVVGINNENKTISIRGAVPGSRGSVVEIRK